MGPRSIDRGIVAARLHKASQFRASMGPRSIDRGIRQAIGGGWFRRDASMGPRAIDRGIELRTAYHLAAIRLQWGRDQLIAELDLLDGDAEAEEHTSELQSLR